MNRGGKKSGGDTACSVSEIVDEETEKLLEAVNEEGKFGKRKQEALKALVRIYSSRSCIIPPYRCIGQSFRRDGEFCLLTSRHFIPFDEDGIPPVLAHIIPNSVHGKVCLRTIASEFVSSYLAFSPTR
jgi:hypothetical protein